MTLRKLLKYSIVLPILLFLVALFFRVLWLNEFPVGIVHDNMIFVLNAKAIYFTGHDVTGLWSPFSFAPIPDEPPQAELIYSLLAPAIGILPSSLFSAHIFYAVVNAFFVVLLFLITRKLVGKGPALLVGLVACFNPWNIFFGRSAFEASLVAFLYVLGWYLLLVTKSWKKLYAIVPLALGFYTYMAYKITFIPYIVLISFFTWNYYDLRKYTKQYIVLLILALVIFGSFLIRVKTQSTLSRLSEASFVSQSDIESQVQTERQRTIQNPLSPFVTNKVTVTARTLISKYLGAFSLENFFVQSEWTQRFHIYNHGYFYFLDSIFLLIGFCYMFTYKKWLWGFLVSVIALAPLPSVASTVDVSYAMRSSLYYPFFYLFIGIGIWYSIIFFKKKPFKIFIGSIIAIAYLMLIGNFLYNYFFMQPIYGAEGAAFSARVVAHFVQFANKNNKKTIVVTESPKILYKDFIYFSDNYNQKTTGLIKTAFLTKKYVFQNISFKTCSDTKILEQNTIYIFDPGEKCSVFKNITKVDTIAQLSDSGSIYSIYQDSVCSHYKLKPYIANLKKGDFDLNNLSEEQFCETFIIKYQ